MAYEIKKSKDLLWDESRVGMRNGWAIGQAVQMTIAEDEPDMNNIKKWTQWFLNYANELRDDQVSAYNASQRAQNAPESTKIPKPLLYPRRIQSGENEGGEYYPPKVKN